jgi:hypothetical protein
MTRVHWDCSGDHKTTINLSKCTEMFKQNACISLDAYHIPIKCISKYICNYSCYKIYICLLFSLDEHHVSIKFISKYICNYSCYKIYARLLFFV